MIGKWYGKLFEVQPGSRSWLSVILWWELRRIPYNLLVGFVGLISLLVFLWVDSHHPSNDSDWSIGFSVLGFGILANMAFTGGWVTELFLLKISPRKNFNFGPIAFKRGLIFSLVVCFLPVVGIFIEACYGYAHLELPNGIGIFLVHIIQGLIALAMVGFISIVFYVLLFGPFVWEPLTKKRRKEKWKQALLNPNWEQVSQKLGRPIPKALKQFYEDANFIMSGPRFVARNNKKKGEDSWYLAGVSPVKKEYVLDLEDLPKNSFEIASDGSEGIYYVVIDQNILNRLPVYFYYMDSPKTESNPVKVSNSIKEFSRLPWRKWEGK